MADKGTITKSLKIHFYFVDGDTRILTLKNPKANITKSEWENLDNYIKVNNAILGDRNGATFGRITKATKTTETRTTLDLS